MNGNALMQYTLYNKDGEFADVGQLPKQGIADKYGLSTRDLRVFDLPSGGFPHFLVREHTILIHLFDLRLLVQHNQALVFNIAEEPDLESTSDSNPGSSTGGKDHSVARVFSHELEGKIQGFQASRQPYELRVVEAALASAISVLEADYLCTRRRVANTLQTADLDTLGRDESRLYGELRIISELSRKLASIEQNARQVRNAVHEVLNEDEDMASMYLTDKVQGQPHRIEDHQEVEYLFEAYFKASDFVMQEAASLTENIRRKEEAIQSTLSVRRNQIMVLEAKIEIMMLALSWSTLVAGWYGMNVINYFEEHALAFSAIVSLSFTAIILATWYGMRKLKNIHKLRL
ncbi:hypothetical protein TRICI_003599 [Trichomonascus ciferrii]|uniref:Magnesium transporter n=1 Tax=Trichomonascus ciferrii TaxID=44093 RepID=A0A642V2T5_9ASCO|nr:hypothetical protein TRICI_003599 [Trichomonascus ciferrii]